MRADARYRAGVMVRAPNSMWEREFLTRMPDDAGYAAAIGHVDSVVISCTGVKTLAGLEILQGSVGRPEIGSNSAPLRAGLGLCPDRSGLGVLRKADRSPVRNEGIRQ